MLGCLKGQMGNSEVGHLTIGAGRLLLQSLPRIDNEIYNNGLVSNVAISETMASVADSGGRMHLWGAGVGWRCAQPYAALCCLDSTCPSSECQAFERPRCAGWAGHFPQKR